MQVKGFSHIYLPSRSVDESIEFYTKKLGFNLLRKYSSDGRERAYLEVGGVLLELTPSENTPDQDGRSESRIGLEVPDMDAAMADMKSNGVEVAREPWDATTFWGRQAQIKDPSGYLISLREWRAPDGPYYSDWKPAHDNMKRLA